MEHHDETGCQALEGPILCINNCGFFGSAATMNICSKCYKDLVFKQEQAKLATSSIGSIVNGSGSTSGKELVVSVNADGAIAPLELKTIPAQPSDSSVPSENSGSKVKEGPTRCNTCKKRVGLTGFNCRCGNVLCVMHTIRTSMTANLITGQLLGMQLPRPTLSSRLRSLTKSRDEREDYSSPDSTPLFSIYVLFLFSCWLLVLVGVLYRHKWWRHNDDGRGYLCSLKELFILLIGKKGLHVPSSV